MTGYFGAMTIVKKSMRKLPVAGKYKSNNKRFKYSNTISLVFICSFGAMLLNDVNSHKDSIEARISLNHTLERAFNRNIRMRHALF